MVLNPNLRFILKAQCLYTNLHLMRWISFLIAERKEIFHMLSLIGKVHGCLSCFSSTKSMIRRHVFFCPRPDVLSWYVKSSWHAATKWKQLLVLISLHVFIARYIPCILIPPILPLCCSPDLLPPNPAPPCSWSRHIVIAWQSRPSTWRGSR